MNSILIYRTWFMKSELVRGKRAYLCILLGLLVSYGTRLQDALARG